MRLSVLVLLTTLALTPPHTTATSTTCRVVARADICNEYNSNSNLQCTFASPKISGGTSSSEFRLGIRYPNCAPSSVPANARINTVSMYFNYGFTSDATSLTVRIRGYDGPDGARPFLTATPGDVTARDVTAASVSVSVATFTSGSNNAIGSSTDLVPIVQELVNHASYPFDLGFLFRNPGHGMRDFAAGSTNRIIIDYDARCPPASVAFGTLTNAGIGWVGDSLTLTCSAGYQPSGAGTTMTCLAGATWDTTLACDAIPTHCGTALAAPSFGSVSPDPCNPFTANVCSFSCDSSHYRTGSASRTCDVSGSWTGSQPSCSIRTCPSLSPPSFGTLIVPSPPEFGDAATYACNTGYNLVGSSSRNCDTPSGPTGAAWSTTPPTCAVVDCGTLSQPPPPDGSRSCSGTTYGHSCTFACNTGYVLSGSAVRTCTSAGIWDALANAACSPDPTWCSLSLPAPANGIVTPPACFPATTNSCTFSCNTGYYLTGPTSRTCTVAPPAWSGSLPTCSLRACPSLLPPDDGSVSFSMPADFFTSATYSCNTGYTLSGSATRSCLVEGAGSSALWTSTPPTCAIVDCGPLAIPPPPNGFRLLTTTTYGSNVTFGCSAGFNPVGPALRFCLATGFWSDAAAPFKCSTSDVATSSLTAVGNITRVVGDVWTFYVTARDSDSNVVLTGVDVVSVAVVSPPHLASAPVPASTYTGSLGVYTVAWPFPTVATPSLVVDILLNGAPFPASPFHLALLPGPAYGLTSAASGDGISAPELASTAVFTLASFDQYGNAISVGGDVPDVVVSRDGTPIPSSVLDTGDGSYTASFAVDAPGVYAVTAAYRSVPFADSPWIMLVGSLCPPGSKAVDATTCEECEANTYSDSTNAPFCTPCPTATSSPPSSSAWSNCSCVRGAWNGPPGTRTPDSPSCIPCPPGAECAGGSELPRAAPGFVPTTGAETSAFVACPIKDSCVGSGACARGYTGRFCADCARGFYKLNLECRKCSSGSAAGIVVVFVFAAIALAVGLTYINSRDTAVYGFASFVISLTALQIVTLYGSIDLEWHPFAKTVFSVLGFASLNFDLAAPECSFPSLSNPHLFKWALTMALPLAFAAAFALVAVVGSLLIPFFPTSHRTPARLRSAAARSYLQTLGLLYLPLAYATLSYLDCVELDSGTWVLTIAPDVPCYDSAYWSMIWAVVVCILLYIVGVPMATLGVLARARRSLDGVVFHLRYAFLVARFRPSLYAFETVVMGQKALLAATVTAFRGPYLKASAAVVTLIVTSMAIQSVAPYAWEPHNRMSTAAACAAATVLIGGTVTASTASDVLVVAGLVALILVLAGGVAYEVWVFVSREKAAENEFFAPDMYRSHNIGDDDGAEEAVGAGFESSVELDVMGGGPGREVVADVRSVELFDEQCE